MARVRATSASGGGIDGVYYDDGTWSSAQDGVAIDLGFTPLTITFYNKNSSNVGITCTWSASDSGYWTQAVSNATQRYSLGTSYSNYRPNIYAVSGTTVTLYGHNGCDYKLIATKMN